MKFTLKDYQVDAVAEVLDRLTTARTVHQTMRKTSQFALTATTGAGKTVMAAAAIEALFYGDDSFDFPQDPGAVVLWFSDDPSLNEQTRYRLMEASDKLEYSDLVVIEHPFSLEKFLPGKVYFLNTGKLTKSSLLTRGHDAGDEEDQIEELRPSVSPDLQGYTIWDTIENTIGESSLTLYMVLDEAHRGMGTRSNSDKPTIVKRLINGHAGVPPIPVVWGVSATVARFEEAMAAAEVAATRLALPRVDVDPVLVQESGLLKDDIALDIPAEKGDFDTVLLKRATRKIVESTKEWAAYADDQAGGGDALAEPVVPLMVLQSPNTPNADDLARAIDTIYSEWPGLAPDAVAHVFGDHTTQQWGRYAVPYVSPERVQDWRHVRVLVAKDAISTGWDCPRAEVMISFRPAKDATHITQLLGRMVRTPLARRIPGNEKLNSVECILPQFDHKTATNVVKVLTGSIEGLPDGGGERRVLIDPKKMEPNPSVEERVWAALEALPTQSLPRKGAKPIKRLTALAHALASDELLLDAGKVAHREMHHVLDGLAARYPDKLAEATSEIWTVHGETITGRAGSSTPTVASFAELADDRSIQDAFRAAGRVLSPALAGSYVDHLAGPDDDMEDDGLRDAYVRVAALALIPEVSVGFDNAATGLTQEWFDSYRVAIKDLSDERQAVYNDIKAMSTDPQRMSITRPVNAIVETKSRDDEGNERTLPTATGHLLSDAEGNYPIGFDGDKKPLNGWEREVLAREMGRPGALAWYRNPARTSQDSLGVAYKDGKGNWRTLHPDFLFFGQGASPDGVRVSIVDPHSHHLGDALAKLRGLAEFATEYGTEFHRIEAVTKVGNQSRVLDLKSEHVRAAVMTAQDPEVLYASHAAGNY